MNDKDSQRVIVVTGASGGIGQAVVACLGQLGFDMVLVDSRFDDLPGTVNNLSCRRVKVDLAAPDAGQVLNREIPRSLIISGLVNVAGIQRMGALSDSSIEDFDKTFSVNVRGAFLATQWAANRMRENNGGSIVTISSTSGRMPRVNQGIYCASKAALTQMMRVFGLELARHGIRVNTIAPGSTDTPMVRNMAQSMGFGGEVLDGSNEEYRLGIPLKRIATPEDIAQAVAFLMSDNARHITMHEMIIDGGGTLGL